MSVSPQERAELSLADYLAVLRRQRGLILAVALAIPILAFVWSSRQAPVYRATSEVLLSTQNLGSAVTGISTGYVDPGRFGETQAALARVPAVAQAAIRRARVRGLTPGELLSSSTVAPRDDADFLVFTVENRRRDYATRLATTYAQAFTAYKLTTDTRTLALARRELQGRLDELRAQGATRGALYRDLQQKIQDLRTLELLQAPATVVASASDADKVAPTPVRNAVLGLVLGILLAIGIALLRNTLDRTIRSEEEIERALGLPLLARLPTPERRLGGDERLAMLDEPSDASAEAVRILRTNLELANVDLGAKVIMVTSAGPGEGKTTTVANLAVALGRAGRSVALVDLDLRQPLLGTLFGITGRAGVTDVAQGHVPLERALAPLLVTKSSPRTIRGLAGSSGDQVLLTAGSAVPSPGELIGSERLTAMFDELRDRYDVVLVDAPPLLGVGDAMTLSARVDAVFVVVRVGTVDVRTLKELARGLRTVPAPKLGFVLTDVDPRHTYGSRAYGSGAGRGTVDVTPQTAKLRASLRRTQPTLGTGETSATRRASENR